MSLLFAAVGALVAALVETSVFPDLTIAGAKPDLVFVLAVVTSMMVGVEDGLVWASLGGLMLDMLLHRPVGATMLSLLIVVGLAILVARLVGADRRAITILAVFSLTWGYQFVSLAVLAMTSGVAFSGASAAVVLPIALFNAILAIAAVGVAHAVVSRGRPTDRLDW